MKTTGLHLCKIPCPINGLYNQGALKYHCGFKDKEEKGQKVITWGKERVKVTGSTRTGGGVGRLIIHK